MTLFVDANQVASLLEKDVTPGLQLVVDLTNQLIEETWNNPEPGGAIPTRVKTLALEVAVRAGANPKGLTSWTRSWDDVARTERMENSEKRRLGVYLTDDEILELNGAPSEQTIVGSIHVRIADRPC